MDHDLITKLTGQVIAQMRQRTIPLGISNRHVHLSAKDYQSLFPGQTLKIKKPLGQPGQFAAEQTVSLIGPRGQLKNVRILGPLRGQTQVEISYTDARQIGLTAPLRLSGDLTGSVSVTLKSEAGEINLTEGVIIARRHIHMSPLDAAIFGVTQGETVKVGIEGTDRKLIFDDVCIRVAEDMRLEMHIDAAGIDGGQAVARLLLTKR